MPVSDASRALLVPLPNVTDFDLEHALVCLGLYFSCFSLISVTIGSVYATIKSIKEMYDRCSGSKKKDSKSVKAQPDEKSKLTGSRRIKCIKRKRWRISRYHQIVPSTEFEDDDFNSDEEDSDADDGDEEKSPGDVWQGYSLIGMALGWLLAKVRKSLVKKKRAEERRQAKVRHSENYQIKRLDDWQPFS